MNPAGRVDLHLNRRLDPSGMLCFTIIFFLVRSHLPLLPIGPYQSCLVELLCNSRGRWLLMPSLDCNGWTISPSITSGPRCGATTSRIRIACELLWDISACRLCATCPGVTFPLVIPFQPCLTSMRPSPKGIWNHSSPPLSSFPHGSSLPPPLSLEMRRVPHDFRVHLPPHSHRDRIS